MQKKTSKRFMTRFQTGQSKDNFEFFGSMSLDLYVLYEKISSSNNKLQKEVDVKFSNSPFLGLLAN